ncbi:MAG: undecaprenyl-diphosphate phosphatase [Thermoplasmatota archaeon]
MDWLDAIVLGVVQGVTEWLPVSSSGHLALVQRRLGDIPLLVDVLLHVGTLIVLLVFFWRDVAGALKGAVEIARSIGSREGMRRVASATPERRAAAFVAIGTVPTAVMGLAINYWAGGDLFSRLPLVALGFLLTGALLALTPLSRMRRGREIMEVRACHGLLMGAAQGVAILPGFSRSGWTIGAGLLSGMDGETAVRLSFLLCIPGVIGALLLRLSDLSGEGELLAPALLGMAVAAVVGYICLGLLVRVVKRGGIHLFAPYCIAVGALALAGVI